MNNFIKLLKELKTTNSNKDKEAILEKYKDDEQVKELLNYNLNPYLMFHIKKLAPFDLAKWKPDPSWSAKDRYECFISLLKDLNGRRTTGNLARDTIEGVFTMLNRDEYEAYGKVLLKKPIGIGTSTVNKVIKDFIPVFDVMKAPTELANISKLTYPRLGQPKYDGFRAVYIPYEDDLIFGSSGLPIRNKRAVDYFKSLQVVADHVADGEIYSHERSFEEIASILSSEDKEIPNDFKYIIFDMIPVNDWKAKSCKLTYEDRLRRLREIVQSDIADRKRIIDVPTEELTNSAEAVEFYKKCLKEEYEGSMLWHPLGYYQWRRVTVKSGEILKLKKKDTVDVEVKEIFEGEGKFSGMAGGIIFDFNGVAVRCGSGFTDKDREEMAKTPTKFIGKMAEIEYMEETTEKSLRHPVFFRWRFDKLGN